MEREMDRRDFLKVLVMEGVIFMSRGVIANGYSTQGMARCDGPNRGGDLVEVELSEDVKKNICQAAEQEIAVGSAVFYGGVAGVTGWIIYQCAEAGRKRAFDDLREHLESAATVAGVQALE